MVVVDDLDERLDLGSLLLSCLGHATGDLAGVALDAGDQSVAVGVRLVASVDGLEDHDLNCDKQKVSKSASEFFPQCNCIPIVYKTPQALELFLHVPTNFCPSALPSRIVLPSINRDWVSHLLSGVAATGDNGNTANLEELHFLVRCGEVVVSLVVVERVEKGMGASSCENGGGCNWPRFCLAGGRISVCGLIAEGATTG